MVVLTESESVDSRGNQNVFSWISNPLKGDQQDTQPISIF